MTAWFGAKTRREEGGDFQLSVDFTMQRRTATATANTNLQYSIGMMDGIGWVCGRATDS